MKTFARICDEILIGAGAAALAAIVTRETGAGAITAIVLVCAVLLGRTALKYAAESAY